MTFWFVSWSGFTLCYFDSLLIVYTHGKQTADLGAYKTMTFREELPLSCPPQQTKQPTANVLWRLLKSSTVVDKDFDSAVVKNPGKSFPDPCSARGISLVPSLQLCKTIVKSPKARMHNYTHAVDVAYTPTAGIWHQDKDIHVCWWILANTDPLNLVGTVESLI